MHASFTHSFILHVSSFSPQVGTGYHMPPTLQPLRLQVRFPGVGSQIIRNGTKFSKLNYVQDVVVYVLWRGNEQVKGIRTGMGLWIQQGCECWPHEKDPKELSEVTGGRGEQSMQTQPLCAG